ncbi:uncharacterized protein LOC107369825 [Tetranychus urticae]|uniref:uncharacterized protein LOC107369825 n=1 Tax=Tetranychus urticae TaxID=32264 RepID=UPI00077B9019|nr:uncharacterized protein LOC107369825 [Tetranychus urticae]
MIYQQLIISIGLLCCCHLTTSETNKFIEPQENHGNQKDINVLVNNLSHLREPALPSSTNHLKDCNHRSKRSTLSNLGTARESERFTAFSLLPSAANRSVFICPEKFGYFPDKRDCTKYFVCVFGEPLHESCTGGLYFSAELQTCDWPRNVQCPNEKKNYEKSVFSTVDIGSGDDGFDYDVRQSTNSQNNNNKRPNTVKEEPSDEDEKDRPNGINANYNKIIIRTNNSSFVRPIEHYVVDKEIPDYTLVDDQPVGTVTDKNNSNRSSPPQASFIPSPPPSTPLDGGQRNSINFEAHSQPAVSKAPEIDYLTDGLPLPSPKPIPRPATIYSSAESDDNSGKPFIESSRPRENQNRYSENHGNKINLEFDPQAPNYAEAIPPVVDSKGGIHFSDGVGGTFGIVDQLPGLLSQSVSDHSLNVFIKPLSSDSIKSGRSREARLLKDNIEPGYEYIPIITPEKSNFRSNNPFLPPNNYDESFHSTSKSSGSRGRSASRPNEQPTGNLLAAVGSKMKSSDPEDDFKINENVTRTLSNNSEKSIPENMAHKPTNLESNSQLLRKDGNEEFILVPFNINEGRRRHRGRVRVVPKIVPKNKLHQVKMMNKNFKMLPNFIEAKTDGSVVVRAKPIGFNENLPSLSSNSVSSPSSRQPESKDFSFDKSSSLPFRSSIPASPPKNQPPISSSLTRETNLMSFPLPPTESNNAAYNVQWNKGTIEFPDSDSNRANFIASLISNDKAIINLDNNHLTSNNGLSDDRSTSTSSDPKKDQVNNERPVITSTSIGISSSTTTTTTSTTPSPISMAPIPSNTPFIGKILRTLRPQTIYSEPVKIITNSLVTGKPEKRVVTNPRLKVEDELTWPDDGFLSINKEAPNSRLVNGLKDSRVLPTTRQQSTPSLPATKDSLQTTSPVVTPATASNLDSTTTPLPSPSLPPSPQSPLSSFSSIPIDGTTGITLGPKTRGPTTRKSRPTNKRLVVKQRTTIAPKPPSRPAPVYPTPTPYTTAVKCDPRKCLLPDCNCGGPAIPGGLKRNETPQVVLLTFDDAVNDLNWELYEEIFNSGRVNPNGCPILGTFYASHEWTDYGQVQTLYSRGHEFASHTVTHSFGEKFSKSQWHKEVNGQREILHLYGGVRLEDIRGMRAPFLQIGGNRMFEMLHEDNFTYDSSMPVFDNRPPFWPYTLDYALNHDCMISPCPTKSFPGVWEVGMVMWEDLKGGRCSMADSCSNPSDEEGVFEMLLKNFNRHYTTNKAPFGLFYHSAWFNTNHHRRGFLKFVDTILANKDVYILTNWQLIEWMRNPTPLSSIKSFQPWSCENLSSERPGPCHHPNVCNVRYQSGTRFMKTCQPCPERYPWVGGANKHSN